MVFSSVQNDPHPISALFKQYFFEIIRLTKMIPEAMTDRGHRTSNIRVRMFDDVRYFLNIEMFDVRMFAISATKIFAPFCPFLRYFPYRKKCSKMTEILLRYWQISQKKDKKPKIFVALMNDIATRRDCDIIATLSVATISQPCGSRYTDNVS